MSRCSASGGSWSSTIPQSASKSFLPRKPARRPPAMLNGRKMNFIARSRRDRVDRRRRPFVGGALRRPAEELFAQLLAARHRRGGSGGGGADEDQHQPAAMSLRLLASGLERP